MEHKRKNCEHDIPNTAPAAKRKRKCLNVHKSIKQLRVEAIAMTTRWAEQTWLMHSELRDDDRLETCQKMHDEEEAWKSEIERNSDKSKAAMGKKESLATCVESFKRFRMNRMHTIMHESTEPKDACTRDLKTYTAQRWDAKTKNKCAICLNIPERGKRITKLNCCYQSMCQACAESHFIVHQSCPYCNSKVPYLNTGIKAPWTKEK